MRFECDSGRQPDEPIIRTQELVSSGGIRAVFTERYGPVDSTMGNMTSFLAQSRTDGEARTYMRRRPPMARK